MAIIIYTLYVCKMLQITLSFASFFITSVYYNL